MATTNMNTICTTTKSALSLSVITLCSSLTNTAEEKGVGGGGKEYVEKIKQIEKKYKYMKQN